MFIPKKIKTKQTEIWIDEEGILIVEPFEGAELDLDEVKLCFEVYKELGANPNNKLLQLINTIDGSMDPDARAFSANAMTDYFIASAIVSNSLAVRLIVNFFNTFYQSKVPFKMFSNEEDARKWLNSFKENKVGEN